MLARLPPTWIAPDRAWRIAATVALAMADAAEEVAGLPVGAVRPAWPNDLVIETGGPKALLVGELSAGGAAARLAARSRCASSPASSGEPGLGSDDPRVVVGIGITGDWAAADFPPELADTMTSLREASAGRPIDATALLDAFTERVEVRIEALRAGVFDVAGWTERQATTGRLVTLDDDGARAATGPRAGRRCALGRARGRGGAADPDERSASASSTRARSPACASRRRRCNAMPGPVFGRRERSTAASVVVLDRDRSLVEAARRDPRPLRRPVSEVPRPGVLLRPLRAR